MAFAVEALIEADERVFLNLEKGSRDGPALRLETGGCAAVPVGGQCQNAARNQEQYAKRKKIPGVTVAGGDGNDER